MQLKRQIAAILFLLAVRHAGVMAAETGMALPQIVRLALRDNPRLAVARAEWDALREMPAQVGALPNPMIVYKGMDTANRFPGTAEQRYAVEQSIPWPGKRALKSLMAENGAAEAKYALEALELETALQAKEAFYELGSARQAIAILRDEEKVLRQIAQVAETRYAAGDITQQALAGTQSEITMVRGRLLEWQARETTAQARLNTLMNREPTAALDLREEPVPATFGDDPTDLIRAAQTNRPEIKALQAATARGENQRSLMRKENLPDFLVGLEYRQSSELDDMAMFMVGLDMPIWVAKNRAGVREAENRLSASRAAVESLQREIQEAVDVAWARLQAAQQTLALYEKELIPQAELRFSASEVGYRTGQSEFAELLESERFLLNARLMRIMAEADVGMRSARLEWTLGTGRPNDQKIKEEP